MLIPNNFAETKVRNLDASYASPADSRNKFTLVFLFFVILTLDRVLGRNDRYTLEKKILGFNIAVECINKSNRAQVIIAQTGGQRRVLREDSGYLEQLEK